jgi:hypothetical protein
MKQGKRHGFTLAWPEESGQCLSVGQTLLHLHEVLVFLISGYTEERMPAA